MTENSPFKTGEADQIAHLLAEKPERLIPFDEERMNGLRELPGLVIGEVAGADSVAAVLLAMEDDDVVTLLPVAVYTGTECGDWQSLHRNVAFLREEAARRTGKEVLELTWMGAPQFWHAFVGRFMTEIIHRFGRYSPCLACHLFVHALRIPLARALGIQTIVGGDRERHGGSQKIDQLAGVIDATDLLFREFGLELRQPLRGTAKIEDVLELLGPGWQFGSPQPVCLFSRNYWPLDSSAEWREEEIMAFIDRHAVPVLRRIIAALIEGHSVDYVQVIQDYLQHD